MIDTKKIKQHLPRNYSKKLQRRIKEKTGREYSLSMILAVLADNPRLSNDDIIAEAVAWAQEIKIEKLEISKTVACL